MSRVGVEACSQPSVTAAVPSPVPAVNGELTRPRQESARPPGTTSESREQDGQVRDERQEVQDLQEAPDVRVVAVGNLLNSLADDFCNKEDRQHFQLMLKLFDERPSVKDLHARVASLVFDGAETKHALPESPQPERRPVTEVVGARLVPPLSPRRMSPFRLDAEVRPPSPYKAEGAAKSPDDEHPRDRVSSSPPEVVSAAPPLAGVTEAGRPADQPAFETLSQMGFGASDIGEALGRCAEVGPAVEWLLSRS